MTFETRTNPFVPVETLVDILSRSAREEDKLARNPSELGRILNEARAQGYAAAIRARRVSDEISLAVPVRTGDRVLACLTVRMKTAQERFLPRLAAAAARIRDEFDRQHAGSNRS